MGVMLSKFMSWRKHTVADAAAAKARKETVFIFFRVWEVTDM